MQPRSKIIEQIYQAGIQEAIENLKLPKIFTYPIKPMISKSIYNFAKKADEYDQRINQDGLSTATQWFLTQFVSEVNITGRENIPEQGPLLITPNHAGGVDFLSVMASIPRNDFRLIANEHAIISPTQYLPEYLLFTGSKANDRTAVIYSILKQLNKGHAVVVFPAGLLEPDPKLIPGAQEHLYHWSPSLGIFVKKIPDLKILPVVIGGTVSGKLYNMFFSRVRKSIKQRTKTTILIQYMVTLAFSKRFPVTLDVTIGKPIDAKQLTTYQDNPRGITQEIITYEKSLMNQVYPQSARPLGKWY